MNTASASSFAPYQSYEQTGEIIRVRPREIVSTANPKDIIGADKLQACLCVYLEDPRNGVRTMASVEPAGVLDKDLVPHIIESFTRKGGNIDGAKCRVFSREFEGMWPNVKVQANKLAEMVKSEFEKHQTNKKDAEQNFHHVHTNGVPDSKTGKISPLNDMVNAIVLSVPRTDGSYGLCAKIVIIYPESINPNSPEWKHWVDGIFEMLAADFNFPPADKLKTSPKVSIDPKMQDNYTQEISNLCNNLERTRNVNEDSEARKTDLILKKCIDREDTDSLRRQWETATKLTGPDFSPIPLPKTQTLSASSLGQTAARPFIRWRDELRTATHGSTKKERE